MTYVTPHLVPLLDENPITRIERCIRVAYKSEDKIGPGSAERILSVCTSRKHLSVLAHANAFVKTMHKDIAEFILGRNHKYLELLEDKITGAYYVYGNFRAWYETLYNPYGLDLNTDIFENDPSGKILESLAHLTNMFSDKWPELFKIRAEIPANAPQENPFDELDINANWYTFLVTTDIGVGKEWLRHTTLPPTQESTRYVNYGTKGLQICLPYPFEWAPQESLQDWIVQLQSEWADLREGTGKKAEIARGWMDDKGFLSTTGLVEMVRLAKVQTTWEVSMETSECAYNRMLNYGCKPQEARSVLSHSTATTFAVSGDRTAWDHFILLRDAEDAHPQIQILAQNVHSYFLQQDKIPATSIHLGLIDSDLEHLKATGRC